jgi:Subtilase family
MRKVPSRTARRSFGPVLCLLTMVASASSATVWASDLDVVGVTLLRAITTNLDGAGIRVAQAEAQNPANTSQWEANPVAAGIGLPPGNFTCYTTNGSTSTFPNSLGGESGHADAVGAVLYGLPAGISTNLAHVDIFEGDYFALMLVPSLTPINDLVVNQSFVAPTNYQAAFDDAYDNYSEQYHTLFVSGVGDGGGVYPPSTSYNGIGVGAYGGATSVGPTPDNGRAKPDLTAPGDATSYTSPLVAGAAAVLLQAGARGDGGDTNFATDARTIKALLLNGAVKPADWANPSPSPLDPRYGTGVLNVFNSYRQLAGGRHAFTASSSVPAGGAHPPVAAMDNITGLNGWDLNTSLSTASEDGVNHYCFELNNSNAGFTATVTLTWNRQFGQTSINDLDLFLYNADSGVLVASSVSLVDNVEHLHLNGLPPGRYDLQVLKKGGATVSAAETYALAFEFFPKPVLYLTPCGGNVLLSWPVYPAGFTLESSPISAPVPDWTAMNAVPGVTNNENRVLIPSSGVNQFFRLRRP